MTSVYLNSMSTFLCFVSGLPASYFKIGAVDGARLADRENLVECEQSMLGWSPAALETRQKQYTFSGAGLTGYLPEHVFPDWVGKTKYSTAKQL